MSSSVGFTELFGRIKNDREVLERTMIKADAKFTQAEGVVKVFNGDASGLLGFLGGGSNSNTNGNANANVNYAGGEDP